LTSTDPVGVQFEDEFNVDAGDEEIAALQTDYFSKPYQNPVFSGTQENRERFRGGFVSGSFAPHSGTVRLNQTC
jgi:hypothetical protein